MKKTLLIIIAFSLTTHVHSQGRLDAFNKILGTKQSEAFDQAVESYGKFLELNYSVQTSVVEQNLAFLDDFINMDVSNRPNWKFPNDIEAVLEQWEESGLRKEMWLWPNEHYEPNYLPEWDKNDSTSGEWVEDEVIPITPRNGQVVNEPLEQDSSLSFNTWGKYLYALNQCCSSDTLVSRFVEAVQGMGDVSPFLAAKAFSAFGKRLNDPIVMRMIVAEFYYFQMKHGNE